MKSLNELSFIVSAATECGAVLAITRGTVKTDVRSPHRVNLEKLLVLCLFCRPNREADE